MPVATCEIESTDYRGITGNFKILVLQISFNALKYNHSLNVNMIPGKKQDRIVGGIIKRNM